MDFDSEKYDLVCEQLKQCLLPEFDRDIGDEPLEKADFHTFRYGLEMNLQLLFSVIAKNEYLLLDPMNNNETFRVNFILLIQQQSHFENASFQTDNASILKHLRLLKDKYYKKLWSNPKIRSECMQYYKDRLTADKWKRNIGAVHGFIQMYNLHKSLIKTKITSDEILFMLSVGMLLTDYFEMDYKRYGLIISNTLLEFGDSDALIKLNVFEVIYKRLMNPLIVIAKDEITMTLVLSCLFKCIKAFDKWQNPSEWNEIDDIFDEIMKRLAFETDTRCFTILLLFISRITTLPIEKMAIIQSSTNFEHLNDIILAIDNSCDGSKQAIDQLRDTCKNYHNLLISRWTKKLMDIFTQKTVAVLPTEIKLQLHVLHICYLCCLYGNPLLVEMNLTEFLNSIVLNILHTFKSNQNNKVFVNEIKEMLKTFSSHVNGIGVDDKQISEFEAFQKSLDLLNNEIK